MPIFSLKKSGTILARCDGSLSWIKIQVLLIIIWLTSERSFFEVFFTCCGIDFQTLVVQKKRLRSTFPRYTSRNHYLFWLSIGVMEKAIILNIIFIFKSIDTTVLRVWRNIQMKFLFILQYTFFDKTTFPKSVKASALSVCLPFVPRCLQTFKVFVFLSYLVVFQRLNCFNPLLFIIPSPVLFQPLLATCGSQDYLLVNRLNFK